MKKCTKCGIEKELTEFCKDAKGKDGIRAKCKICCAEEKKEYYKNNREKVLEKRKEYRKNNKEKIKEYKKEYQIKNREKTSQYSVAYQREKLHNNPVYRMMKNYRTRTRQAYKTASITKTKGTMKLLGCSGRELKEHLEKQFQPGMTHENYGEWHIDHIRPCASFDLSDPKQQEACFHYTNLQPLWAQHNLSKGAKY